MAMSDRHPSAERLAEYLDDVLSKADRAAVERHLADCADCRELVSDTMDLIAGEEPIVKVKPSGDPFRLVGRALQAGASTVRNNPRLVKAVTAGLAAAAILVLAIRVARPEWLRFGPRTDRPELQELIAALANEPTRPVDGWLSGFGYASQPSQTRGPGDPRLSPEVNIVVLRIERASRRSDSDTLRLLGLSYLIKGRLDEAIQLLGEEASSHPSAVAFNDLAVAYLARAARANVRDDYGLALTMADRALSMSRDQREPAFNKVLALIGLGRDGEAATIAADYFSADPSSPWASELRARLNH